MDRPAPLDRADRLRDIVTEVGRMIIRAEEVGDRGQAESLRVLLRHFESEFVQLVRLGSGDPIGRDIPNTSALPDKEGGT